MNSGMTSSGDQRVGNAMGTGGLGQSGGLLEQILGAATGGNTNANTTGSSGNDLFGSLLKVATNALGGGGQGSSTSGSLASAGLGALTDALFGGSSSGTSAKGSSLGGGAMAMLAGLAFQAFKNMNRQPAGVQAAMGSNEIPLGLRAPTNDMEEQELEQTATLVLKGMINAAKSDGQMGNKEIQKIIGRIKEDNDDDNLQQLILDEMQKPLDLDGLVNEIPNEAVAAQVYAASLFAIEVDTPAEREYLEQFVQRTGLDTGVAQHLQKAVGMS
jgi:uncharacterized membrane protein YebE (DUF533 family)